MEKNQCNHCVWSDKISNNILYCILPRCIIKEEVPEQIATIKKKIINPKIRIACSDKKKGRKRKCVH